MRRNDKKLCLGRISIIWLHVVYFLIIDFKQRAYWLTYIFFAIFCSHKNTRYSQAYINFNRPEDVVEFAEYFDGHTFVNEKGNFIQKIFFFPLLLSISFVNNKSGVLTATLTYHRYSFLFGCIFCSCNLLTLWPF